MQRIAFIGFVLVILALFASPVFGVLSCVTQNSACTGDYIPLFKVSSETNAHAEILTEGFYNWYVCCEDPEATSLSDSCLGTQGVDYDIALKLSSSTNAHVEQKDQGNYPNEICIGDQGAGVSASCTYTTGSCAPTAGCVSTISSATNAHVADCDGDADDYSIKVCCDLQSDTSGPILTFVPPTPDDATISQGDAGDNVDWIYVNVSSNEPLSDHCTIEWGFVGSPSPYSMTYNPEDMTCYWNSSILGGMIDADYEYTVYGTDLMSNVGNSETRTVTIEVDYPTVEITDPNEGDLFNSGDWIGQIEGTASDIQNGISQVEIQLTNIEGETWNGGWVGGSNWLTATDTGGGTWSSWIYTLSATHSQITAQARATDNIGKIGYSSFVTFSIDTYEPDTLFDFYLGGGTTGANPVYSGTSSDLKVESYTSSVESVQVKVDYKTCPICPWLPLVTWTSDGVSINVLDSENVAFEYTVITSMGEVEEYRVQARGVDYAGNIDPSPVSDTFVYAAGNPTITITSPQFINSPYNEGEWNTDNPVQGTATDNVQVDSVEVQIINGSGWYWNGLMFQDPAGGEIWNLANDDSGASTDWLIWSYPFDPSDPAAGDGLYTIRANATDNEEFSTIAQITIIYDSVSPQVWIEDLEDFTTINSFPVGWDGTDETSGIKEFVIQYKELEDGLVLVENCVSPDGFCDWITSPDPHTGLTFGPSDPVTIMGNNTYIFRANATDFADNSQLSEEENTTIDLLAPVCTMDTVQGYTSTDPPANGMPLVLSWDVTEEGSGVYGMGVWLKYGAMEYDINDPLISIFNCDSVDSETRTATCTNILFQGQYEVKCGARDLAGNIGPNSTSQPFVADNSVPDPGEILQPSNGWANSGPSFFLQWNATDIGAPPSGIDYFNVQWNRTNPETGWTDLTNYSDPNLDVNSINFGAGAGGYDDPTDLVEGDEFHFRVRGIDNAGNIGPWTLPPERVVIDTISPAATLVAYNQTYDIITGNSLANVTDVHIASNVSDEGSGIDQHTIIVESSEEGLLTHEEFNCPSSEYCQANISVGEKFEITYWTVVTDIAANEFETEHYILSLHPLANFVTHDVFIILGTKSVIDVQIRNLNTTTVNLNLSLEEYPLAGFIDGTGDFSDMVIYDNGRKVGILDLRSGGRGTIKVELISSDPSLEGQRLTLNAKVISEDGGITDYDEAFVVSIFSPSFSGLSDWAVVLLVLLAVGMFAFIGRKPKRKGGGEILLIVLVIILIIFFFLVTYTMDFKLFMP